MGLYFSVRYFHNVMNLFGLIDGRRYVLGKHYVEYSALAFEKLVATGWRLRIHFKLQQTSDLARYRAFASFSCLRHSILPWIRMLSANFLHEILEMKSLFIPTHNTMETRPLFCYAHVKNMLSTNPFYLARISTYWTHNETMLCEHFFNSSIMHL